MDQKPGVIIKNPVVLVRMTQDKLSVAEDKCTQVDPDSSDLDKEDTLGSRWTLSHSGQPQTPWSLQEEKMNYAKSIFTSTIYSYHSQPSCCPGETGRNL